MAKEPQEPVVAASETILEQQTRGVSTLSSVMQVGVGIATLAASLFSGLPLYLAAPIASGLGVIANTSTSYIVGSNVGKDQETNLLARAAGATARQADKLASHLPRTLFKKDKEDKKKDEVLTTLRKNGGRGLYYLGGLLTFASVVADVAKSFFPIPTPSITAIVVPSVFSGIFAFNSFADGSKKALKDTTVGDAQEAFGGMAKAVDDTAREAVRNHVATSVAGVPVVGSVVQGISLLSAIGSMVTQCATIWHLNRKGIRNAAEGVQIAKKCSSYHQVNSSLKIFAIVAIAVGAILLTASTFGAAAGVAVLAVLSPAVVGGVACICGAVASAFTYYYHGSKTFDQVMADEERQKAAKEGKASPAISPLHSRAQEVAAAHPVAKQALAGVTHHPHEGDARKHPPATTDRPKATPYRSRDGG